MKYQTNVSAIGILLVVGSIAEFSTHSYIAAYIQDKFVEEYHFNREINVKIYVLYLTMIARFFTLFVSTLFGS